MVYQNHGSFKRYEDLECAGTNRDMFVSDTIINMSKYKLNAAEISLLNKGLTFVPTVKLVPLHHINECKHNMNARHHTLVYVTRYHY